MWDWAAGDASKTGTIREVKVADPMHSTQVYTLTYFHGASESSSPAFRSAVSNSNTSSFCGQKKYTNSGVSNNRELRDFIKKSETQCPGLAADMSMGGKGEKKDENAAFGGCSSSSCRKASCGIEGPLLKKRAKDVKSCTLHVASCFPSVRTADAEVCEMILACSRDHPGTHG